MKDPVKESVVVNYYSRMRVQRVFPLIVKLPSVPGSPSGRVQVRPVIPGALVTPYIREVDIGPDGSSVNFSVTAMACGGLPHARLGIYQDGREVGNVALGMKGVRQLDAWIFLLLAVMVPVLIYFFTSHLDWSRLGNAPRARVVPPRMPFALDTPLPANADQRPPGGVPPPAGGGGGGGGGRAGAGVQNLPDTPALATTPALTGVVERTIVDVVPEFNGITRPVAVQMQECYEIIQNVEKTYQISLYVGIGFLALALISGFMNRSTRVQRSEDWLVASA